MNLFRCFAISFALSFAAACSSGPGTDFKVASPDGTLCVGIRAADSLTYTVRRALERAEFVVLQEAFATTATARKTKPMAMVNTSTRTIRLSQ